jgi:Antitoxin Xre/MbcA/ParS C-terminal toxin-binding domain/Antitoxin Xre-like helix-turn-helix domain
MMPAQSPVAKPASKPIPDLSREETRTELSPAALDAFLTLSDIWRLSTKQAVALLGEGSERTWFRIKAREWDGTLSQDSLTRVSALVGIYKGLHLLFSEGLADEWVRRPNTEDFFGGNSPLDFMIAEGIPAMIQTRGYIDALRGGL